MGIRAASPTQREMPLSNRTRFKGEVQVATTTRRAYQCGAQGRTNPYERGRPVMRLEQRGWAKRLSLTSNWQQEETLAATKP